MMLDWTWATLDDLSARQWHQLAMLRQSVFVVEQQCPYPDLDKLDSESLHLLGFDPTATLVACLRLVPPGRKYPEPSLGRIAVTARFRRQGLGVALVREGLAMHRHMYPGMSNTIGAQCYLHRFYARLGYAKIGEPYLEDGIAHVCMRCPATVALVEP